MSGLSESSIHILVVSQLTPNDLRDEINLRLRAYDNLNYYPSVDAPKSVLLDLYPDARYSYYSNVTQALDALNQKMADNDVSQDIVVLVGDTVSSRMRRASDSTSQNNTNFIYGNECVATFGTAYVLDQTGGIDGKATEDLEIDELNAKFDCSESNATLTIRFLNSSSLAYYLTSIKMVFGKNSKDWFYIGGNATSTKNGVSTNYGLAYMDSPYSMITPIGYSYACTTARFVLIDFSSKTLAQLKVNFYLERFQFQPFNTTFNQSSGNFTFATVNYCQGFFSEGIWMAISASLILLAILAFGVTMLTQVTTMDLFDDPRGKPLNIAIEK